MAPELLRTVLMRLPPGWEERPLQRDLGSLQVWVFVLGMEPAQQHHMGLVPAAQRRPAKVGESRPWMPFPRDHLPLRQAPFAVAVMVAPQRQVDVDRVAMGLQTCR